ncbi:MAG: hypothetical protein U5R14_11865 [Gemmatimonadota bacterium]|nr:hypothetical protein [Gemmatimonadota bacterium]
MAGLTNATPLNLPWVLGQLVPRLVDGEPGGLPARAIFAPGRLEACLDAFGREHGNADLRAVVSYWSLWYFGGLLVSSVVATVGLRRALPATVDQVRVTLAPETGKVASFLSPQPRSRATTRGPVTRPGSIR